MNKFQNEVKKRIKKVLSVVGYGDLGYRTLTKLIRDKLKEDIKNGITKL